MRRVTRRLPLAVAALALAGSACTGITDTDVVARVGDAELTQAEFEDRITELGGTDDQVLPLEPLRNEITRWIQLELVGADELAEIYDAGADEAGVVCVSAIVVEDEPAANAAVELLEAGTPFAEVFATANLDQGLAQTGGALPCITSADIADSADVAFVGVAGELTAAAPFGTSPVDDAQGNVAAWVTLVFRPFDELSPDDLDAVVSVVGDATGAEAGADADTDVYVAPRYGVFDRAAGRVVPLG